MSELGWRSVHEIRGNEGVGQLLSLQPDAGPNAYTDIASAAIQRGRCMLLMPPAIGNKVALAFVTWRVPCIYKINHPELESGGYDGRDLASFLLGEIAKVRENRGENTTVLIVIKNVEKRYQVPPSRIWLASELDQVLRSEYGQGVVAVVTTKYQEIVTNMADFLLKEKTLVAE